MHDLVVRGASVVDGTGAGAFRADVAIDGEIISAVGSEVGGGKAEVRADGLVLAPGWIDLHTHYDTQVFWDPALSPSSWHGVTTTIFGNCGIGLAPAGPSLAGREYLARLLEGVEEISAEVVSRIVDWSWETFPEFLDQLARIPLAMDVGTFLPHGPLRLYAMGERGTDPSASPSADELDRMRTLTVEALMAGAFGFSTTLSKNHRTSDDRPAPSRDAGADELAAMADGLRSAGHGVIEVLVDFSSLDGDFAILRGLAARSGAPVMFPLVQRANDPEGFRHTLGMLRDARRDGLQMFGQVVPRTVGILVGLGTGLNPFRTSRRYCQLEALPLAARLVELRKAATKEVVLAELDEAARRTLERVADLGDPPDYFPGPEALLGARSAPMATSAAGLAYDLLVQADGKNILVLPALNFDPGCVREMLGHDCTVLGGSDGGAHYTRTCDASFPTYLLTEWAGPSAAGGFPLEELVRWQTGDVARVMGLTDRGTVRPGMRADLNLIDLSRLRIYRPELIDDLPGGGRRLVQPVAGYEMTLVAGVCTQRGGTPTGHLPGRLVRQKALR